MRPALLPRSTASARMLLAEASRRGMSADECLRDTGLRADLLFDPTREILASQEERLIENIVATLGDEPEIGLDAGASYQLPTFGMFGLMILSARTPREMIEVALRYQDLSASLARARLVNARKFGYMVLDVDHLPPSIRAFVVDHCMAAIWVPAIRIDGLPARATLELTRKRPRSTAAYVRIFGFEPRFGQAANRIGFSHEYLDRARVQVDPAALGQCEEECRRLIERRRATIGISGLVRERLARVSHRWPSMDDVASDLAVSTRTLARRLTEEGTSFREIDASARRARAETLLRETSYPLEQVADALGYATCSAFVRAFKRWHGVPPGTWRSQSAPRRMREPGLS